MVPFEFGEVLEVPDVVIVIGAFLAACGVIC